MYKFKKYGEKEFYKQFCFYRNKVQKAVKNAKATYIHEQLEESKHNPKSLWAHLKSLGYSDTSKSSPNVVLKIKDRLCFEDKNVASDAFKAFYIKRNPEAKLFKLRAISKQFVHKELR